MAGPHMIQLDPPLPVYVVDRKESGICHVLIDYNRDHDLIWVVFMDKSKEVWCVKNDQIRAIKNVTFDSNVLSSSTVEK